MGYSHSTRFVVGTISENPKTFGNCNLTADQPFTSQLIMSNLDWFKYEWIWKKKKTTGFLLANYRPMKETEDVVIFSPGGAAAASVMVKT